MTAALPPPATKIGSGSNLPGSLNCQVKLFTGGRRDVTNHTIICPDWHTGWTAGTHKVTTQVTEPCHHIRLACTERLISPVLAHDSKQACTLHLTTAACVCDYHTLPLGTFETALWNGLGWSKRRGVPESTAQAVLSSATC